MSELKHYGVKGMKWGVRRTPEQLGRHTIPKGTKMYRTTANSNESLSGNKYVTFVDVDRDLYRGEYATEILKNAGNKSWASDDVYEKEYDLNEDLNIPSRAEVKSIIKDALEKNFDKVAKETAKASLETYLNAFEPTMLNFEIDDAIGNEDFFTDSVAYGKRYMKEYSSRLRNMSITEAFVEVTGSFGLSKNNRDMVVDELKRRGYNAMVDEAGVGSTIAGKQGIEPLIIFDGSKSLTETNSRVVSDKEQLEATKRYNKWYYEVNSEYDPDEEW